MSVPNNESAHSVDNLVAAIEARHVAEKERWPLQRVYLNAVAKVSTFLRDCSEITKQLLVSGVVSLFFPLLTLIPTLCRAGGRTSRG